MTATFQMVGKTLRLVLKARPKMVSASLLRQMLVGVLVMMMLSPPPVQGRHRPMCVETLNCQNGGNIPSGYVGFACACVCPEGWEGRNCEEPAPGDRLGFLAAVGGYLTVVNGRLQELLEQERKSVESENEG